MDMQALLKCSVGYGMRDAPKKRQRLSYNSSEAWLLQPMEE
jgi:hypothetical protein